MTDITREQVEEAVESVLGAGFKLERIEEGVNTLYRAMKPGESYIFKFASFGVNNRKYFKAEAEVYQQIQDKTELPSPAVTHVDFSEEIVQMPFFATEELPGENPDPRKNNMTQEELERLYRQYGEILGEIHRELEFESFGYISYSDGIEVEKAEDNWKNWFLEGNLSRVEHLKEKWFGEVKDEAEEILENNLSPLEGEFRATLTHKDNRLENLLVKEGEITGFLDWSKVWAAPGEYDLAAAEYLLTEWDLQESGGKDRDELSRELYRGYRESRDLEGTRDFEKRRILYRFSTVLWLMAGFPHWSENWKEEEQERMARNLRGRFDEERKKLEN